MRVLVIIRSCIGRGAERIDKPITWLFHRQRLAIIEGGDLNLSLRV